MSRPVSGASALVVLLVLSLAAGPASAHQAELVFTFLEGDPCPEGRINCIRVTGGPDTEANIIDDTAEIRFQGTHPIQITVENGGDMDHNLTFEPGTPMANYSIDDPIGPGESVEFNFTTIEDVPPDTYGFYGGQPGHRDLGEKGRFIVVAGPEPEPEQSDIVEDVVGVPGPGLGLALVSLALAALARASRR